jgi:hypothetical protein
MVSEPPGKGFRGCVVGYTYARGKGDLAVTFISAVNGAVYVFRTGFHLERIQLCCVRMEKRFCLILVHEAAGENNLLVESDTSESVYCDANGL